MVHNDRQVSQTTFYSNCIFFARGNGVVPCPQSILLTYCGLGIGQAKSNRLPPILYTITHTCKYDILLYYRHCHGHNLHPKLQAEMSIQNRTVIYCTNGQNNFI